VLRLFRLFNLLRIVSKFIFSTKFERRTLRITLAFVIALVSDESEKYRARYRFQASRRRGGSE